MKDYDRNVIVKQAYDAFYSHKPFKKGNTEIKTNSNCTIYLLYGHQIAVLSKFSGNLTISNNGKFDYDIKQRLNSLEGVKITKRTDKDTKTWYLNGKLWDGTPGHVRNKEVGNHLK